MTRDARAAKTLISELEAHVPDIEVERDDLDGLGVYRTYRLTSETHKGLDDVVSVVSDNRIVNVRSIGKGVEFTVNHSPRLSDVTDAFGVVDAAPTLLSKKRTTKKAAAKKTAAPKDD